MIISHLDITSTHSLIEIKKLTSKLVSHRLYSSIVSINDILIYMEHQVWCVWDFMSLVKAIQNHFISSDIAWLPPTDALSGHQIYEILMTEETDIDETGGKHSSHFETYVRAMTQAGADKTSIERFISELRNGKTIEDALILAKPPEAAKAFVETTIKIARGPIHGVVAAFCLSREGIIPDMFTTFLSHLDVKENLSIFEWYLRRHVAVDSECHGPQSVRLFKHVIGDDPVKQHEALEVAKEALIARVTFLDKILAALPSQHNLKV
ncbi:MAG: hypothetical protein DM484_17295 [Candidatus Methylumidiphilus alinenensis]|uniref:Heme oxygenase n=1 Tax=Candidatus Methylumidiphilus alinenensis TaxID=2202197 RepID=A0A2W4QXN8_9GAMM|nr:MAG: hypothetical protein DM484_17295 [Candidatus Methylumidiphilus alinenensis]